MTLFREILLVPFAIEARDRHDPELRAGRALADALAAELTGSKWRTVEKRWRHLPEDEGASGEALAKAYAEFVYFEPYVQRFLFGSKHEDPKSPPMRLWRRRDIKALDVAVRKPGTKVVVRLRLRVDRLNLYLFDTGNVILVIELVFDAALARTVNAAFPEAQLVTEMKLDVALMLHERVRRVFPPYFSPFDTRGRWLKYLVAPLFPVSLRMVQSCPRHTAPVLADDDLVLATTSTGHLAEHECPPLHPTWLELLEPLPVEGYAGDEGRVVLSQMGDDRAFAHLILGVDNAHAIRREDWVRLAMADEPDEGYFYSEPFLADFERQHCYDRFFETGTWKSTRHLFSPYSYALVSSCAPARTERGWRKREEVPDFDYFRDIFADHGRRHYFQLALISYFQKNALLTLSERLADALHETDEERFRRAAEAIEADVLRFTHRYWFEDISAQIQGQELFDLFRKHLRTRRLYNQVSREVHQTNQVHGAKEQTKLAHEQSVMARQQTEIARAANRLNQVASVGLGLAVFAGLLGMNVFGDPLRPLVLSPELILSLLFGTAALFMVLYSPGGWQARLSAWWQHHGPIPTLLAFLIALLFYAVHLTY